MKILIAAEFVALASSKGKRGHHKTKVTKDKVEHAFTYQFSEPIEPIEMPATLIKALMHGIGNRFGLKSSLNRSLSVDVQSSSLIKFSYAGYGFDEGVVLKAVRLFDPIMVKFGWTNLKATVTTLEGLVERVTFQISHGPVPDHEPKKDSEFEAQLAALGF